MTAPIAQPKPKNPEDRLSGYAIGWLGFVTYFAALEAIAIHQDAKHDDRVKRTLSSNLRYVFATDSIDGRPLRVPFGKLRRLAFQSASNWLETHIQQPGSM